MAFASKLDIDSLRRDNDVLRHDYAQSQALLAAANARNLGLTAEVARLSDMVAKGNDQVTELLAAVNRMGRGGKGGKGGKGGRGGKKPKAPAPPSSLDDEAKSNFAGRPVAPKLPKKKKKTKKKARPTGRKPVPEHLTAEEHELRPDVCGGCGGGELEVVDVIVETKLHVVKEHQRRRVVRRKTCRCKSCGRRTTARSLPSPFERSKATCEWLAWLVHQKFVMLAPLDRIRRDLASRRIHVAMSTLVTPVKRGAGRRPAGPRGRGALTSGCSPAAGWRPTRRGSRY